MKLLKATLFTAMFATAGLAQAELVSNVPLDVSRFEMMAINELTSRATQGNNHAQFYLAKRYQKGEGIAKNPLKAIEWYTRAANQNVTPAQLNLGIMYARGEGVDHFVILPLFPQYSATSGGAVYDAVTKWSLKQRNLPNLTIVKDYFAHPLYIKALADSIRRFQAVHGKPEKLMFSFHGIPQPYADKGDPYPKRCKCTAAQVAHELGLTEDEWIISFQSRFGKQEWVKPYTDVILEEWGKAGVRSVQVVSPAFSADCLETLEELAMENRDNFINAGGKEYHYIPALNDDEAHIDLMEALAKPLAAGWAATLEGWA